MRLSGAAIVIETLISHGVTDIFGYPGGTVLNLYDELYKSKDRINHYISCHEQGATHAADGYARATGKTGVVIATSGPGATNTVTGLATAYLDSTPIVVITGNVPMQLIGRDSFQEVDIAGITMPVTKHNYIVQNIEELEGIICEAFQIAASGRPGPVLIDVPKNIQIAECEFHGGKPLEVHVSSKVDITAIEDAALLIKESKRPYIYAGGGIVTSGAFDELVEFAEKIDAPIGMSMMGLSTVDHKSRRVLGMTGMHGEYASSRAKSEADLIIGAGVRFSDRATGDKTKYQKNAKIIHIDIDPAEIDKNVTAYTSLIGDIKKILPLLCGAAGQQKHSEWMAEIEEFKKQQLTFNTTPDRLTPKEIISCVREFTQEDTIIATDVGQHQMWTAQFYHFSAPRTFVTSGGLGTMGFGLGAAIGASVGTGFKKTVLFTGDGSFHMNLNELATAVTHKVPVVIIIMNNGVLGMVRQWQDLFFEKRFSQTTMDRKTDFVKLADAFGLTGYRASRMEELVPAVRSAFKAEGPVLIECVIDKDEKVFPMIPPNGAFSDIILS